MKERSATELEVLIGRSLAACTHPLVAWRVLSRSWRCLIVVAYFIAAFVTTLGTLLVISPAASL